ncbi:MAG: DNA-3-methyladenine glycosylase [Clostridia bacterium]|nr:DNA-3-methyladenine glycosylase [Clostridia bacterium]
MKLNKKFYTRDALVVAKELLGKYLVREIDGHKLISMITETEAYKSYDKACHAYNYKLTPRTSVIFKEGGIAYVYFTYGMYHCFNVVTDKEGEPSAVLIRSIEPISDMEYMSNLRYKKNYSDLTKYQLKNFSNGPGKLCMAYGIDRELNGENLMGNKLYITEGKKISSFKTGKRIGIDYAEEAKDYLWRFYL